MKLRDVLLMALSGGDPGHFITLSLNLGGDENSTHSIIRFKYINARKTF